MKKIIRFICLGLVLLIGGMAIYFSTNTEVTDNLDTYIYTLPFKAGAKYKVVQAYGGRFSHSYKAALDFDMPAGAPVHAARGGIVYSIKDDSNEGGPFPYYEKKANYIIVRHDDGSFGCYWHLQKNGVLVKQGRVTQGQLIGLSGRTGFVLLAHLHFAVKRKLNYEKDSFVRTKFQTSAGVQLLKNGETYERPLR